MTVVAHDVELITGVCVIGAGAAGLVAALAAARETDQVLVVCKNKLGKGSSTILSGGGFAAASALFSPQEHQAKTMAAGHGLGDSQLVSKLVEAAPAALQELQEQYQIPVAEYDPGSFRVEPVDGMLPPGRVLALRLAQAVMHKGIATLEQALVTGLIVQDGRCQGCRGLLADGRTFLVKAQAVVLSTGGCGGLFARTDNPPGINGAGYGLAAQGGAILRDMEFVQFHPLGLADPNLPSQVVLSPFPPATRLYNAKGADLIASLGGNFTVGKAVKTHRDQLARLIWAEERAGRQVYLDLTGASPKEWETLPSLQALVRLPVDLRRKPVRVSPVAHYCMGGVMVDDHAKTSIPGLYAAGEVAGGVHGANRMGGNGLSECLVFGIAAGQCAAREAILTKPKPMPPPCASDLFQPFAGKAEGGNDLRKLARELRLLMWQNMGPVRDREGLLKAGVRLENLAIQASRVCLNKATHLYQAWELKGMLTTAAMMVKFALRRVESRGSHYRRDHPQTKDQWQHSQFYHGPTDTFV